MLITRTHVHLKTQRTVRAAHKQMDTLPDVSISNSPSRLAGLMQGFLNGEADATAEETTAATALITPTETATGTGAGVCAAANAGAGVPEEDADTAAARKAQEAANEARILDLVQALNLFGSTPANTLQVAGAGGDFADVYSAKSSAVEAAGTGAAEPAHAHVPVALTTRASLREIRAMWEAARKSEASLTGAASALMTHHVVQWRHGINPATLQPWGLPQLRVLGAFPGKAAAWAAYEALCPPNPDGTVGFPAAVVALGEGIVLSARRAPPPVAPGPHKCGEDLSPEERERRDIKAEALWQIHLDNDRRYRIDLAAATEEDRDRGRYAAPAQRLREMLKNLASQLDSARKADCYSDPDYVPSRRGPAPFQLVWLDEESSRMRMPMVPDPPKNLHNAACMKACGALVEVVPPADAASDPKTRARLAARVAGAKKDSMESKGVLAVKATRASQMFFVNPLPKGALPAGQEVVRLLLVPDGATIEAQHAQLDAWQEAFLAEQDATEAAAVKAARIKAGKSEVPESTERSELDERMEAARKGWEAAHPPPSKWWDTTNEARGAGAWRGPGRPQLGARGQWRIWKQLRAEYLKLLALELQGLCEADMPPPAARCIRWLRAVPPPDLRTLVHEPLIVPLWCGRTDAPETSLAALGNVGDVVVDQEPLGEWRGIDKKVLATHSTNPHHAAMLKVAHKQASAAHGKSGDVWASTDLAGATPLDGSGGAADDADVGAAAGASESCLPTDPTISLLPGVAVTGMSAADTAMLREELSAAEATDTTSSRTRGGEMSAAACGLDEDAVVPLQSLLNLT